MTIWPNGGVANLLNAAKIWMQLQQQGRLSWKNNIRPSVCATLLKMAVTALIDAASDCMSQSGDSGASASHRTGVGIAILPACKECQP